MGEWMNVCVCECVCVCVYEWVSEWENECLCVNGWVSDRITDERGIKEEVTYGNHLQALAILLQHKYLRRVKLCRIRLLRTEHLPRTASYTLKKTWPFQCLSLHVRIGNSGVWLNKAKLFLAIPSSHIARWVEVSLHSFWTSPLDQVSSQLHSSPLYPPRWTLVPMKERRETLLVLPWYEPRVS
jgi:hypothetical protein